MAIWMVLILHIFYGWDPPNHNFAPIPGFVMLVIGHGWLGVDLFFILSGFLITGLLLDAKEKPNYFRNFYARRVLRILPVYFAVVLICSFFYPKHDYFVLSALCASNLARLFHIGVPHGPGVFWSLAVEEHFYLIWPLLVYGLNRKRLTILAVCIVALTPVARAVAFAHGMPMEGAIYVYSWFRFDGLALGALMAIWMRSSFADSRNSYRLAGLLVGLSLVITVAGAPFGLMQGKGELGAALRFTQAQLPFAALLLMVVVQQGARWTTVFRSSFARFSGSVSYCLYLIHLSLGDGYQALVRHFGLRPDAMFGKLGEVLVRGLVMLVVSFGVAMLSRKYLEEPILALKRYF